ncbi:MAG: twin-arginine translocation signal domain-containing protein, partial [Nocardiopsaceae bacterium]|nr:twin-arginine translocation signal domain-containing protein [Nocardiopsaceae bacterium]
MPKPGYRRFVHRRSTTPVNPSRRNFLKGAASGAAGTALAGGILIEGARVDA